MARRRIHEPEPEPQDDATTTTADAADDTEGHSIGLYLGMMALDEANRAAERERARRRPAEDLPPITKTFPNMRAAARAQAAADVTTEDAPAAAPALKPATSNP